MMKQEDIAREITAVKDFLTGRVNPLREELDRLTPIVQGILRTDKEMRRAKLTATLSNARPRVAFGPYAGLDGLALHMVNSIHQGMLKNPAGIDVALLERWGANLKAAMDSTTPTTGDELVNTEEARQLWDDVNLVTAVAPLLNIIQMPTNPFLIPLQLGDVNWYPGTENVATKSTSLATNRQTLTAFELVGEVPWSYDLQEDAVIAMMDEVRRTLIMNAAEVIDDVLLNADLSVTNGINSDGTTISTTTVGKAHWLIGFDGMIHLPLIDNTAQRNDHNAAVSDDMFNKIRALLGKYGVNPSQLAYIMDINTFIRSLSVANFRTLDKFGPLATVLTGQLGAVEGIPVIVSEQMKRADVDGKVTDAGNVTNTGRVLLVNRTQWRVGFKRQIMMETVRDVQKRQNIMVISFRMGLQERSGNRTTATHTALQFNITGT